jgi:hypothetical protein
MSPAIPNPWLTLSGPVVAAPAAASTNAAPVETAAQNYAEGDPSVTPDCAGAAARYDEATAGYACCYNCGHREPCDEFCPQSPYWQAVDRIDWSKDRTSFNLDEHAFMSEIEPVPAFLTRPVNQHADEIERLLELARADERPAPPMRRRA